MPEAAPDRPEIPETVPEEAGQSVRSYSFAPILKDIGEFGEFQKTQLFLLCIAASFISVFCNFSSFFFFYTPPHWCRGSSEKVVSLVKSEKLRNQSVYNCYLISDDVNSMTECPFGWQHDESKMKSTIVTKFNLYCDKSAKKELEITLTQGGTILGIFLFSYIQDIFGRKPAFFTCLTVYILTGIECALVDDLIQFIILRAFNEMASVPAFQIPYIMAIEMVGPGQRTMVTSIMAIGFSVASGVLCLIAYLCSDILTFGLVISVPMVVFYSYWWIICESPRWLMMQNRLQELETLIFHIANTNGKALPESYNIAEVMLDTENQQPADLVESTYSLNPPKKTTGFCDLCASPNLRSKVVVLSLLFIINATIYYGVQYGTVFVHDTVMDSFILYTVLALMDIPAAIMNWCLLDRIGRILPCALAMLGAGFAATACFFFYYPVQRMVLLIVSIALTKLCIASTYSIIYQQSAELYPTQARAMGIGTSTICGHIGCLFMPYIIGLSRSVELLPMLILGGISILGALLALFLPETLEDKLPDSVGHVEKRGAAGVKSFRTNLKRVSGSRKQKSASDIDLQETFHNTGRHKQLMTRDTYSVPL